MTTQLSSRITAVHGARTTDLLGELLEASRKPDHAFDVLEDLCERHPELRTVLLAAANTAGRRATYRVTSIRQALVRLGLVAASEVLLHAAHRAEPTVVRAA